jgi:hypothetical protein
MGVSDPPPLDTPLSAGWRITLCDTATASRDRARRLAVWGSRGLARRGTRCVLRRSGPSTDRSDLRRHVDSDLGWQLAPSASAHAGPRSSSKRPHSKRKEEAAEAGPASPTNRVRSNRPASSRVRRYGRARVPKSQR